MLTVQLPAEQARLVLPLVRAAAQNQGVLLPDAAPGQIKAGILESLAEIQALGIGMEHIDGGVGFHVLFHVYESAEQEPVEFIIRHIVVLDFPSRFFYVYVVRWIRQYQIGFLPVHQPCVSFWQRSIAADNAVFPQEPDVTSLGKRTLRKWIENPLKDLDMINQRLDIIEEMNASFDLREDLKELLNQVYDLERITGKMGKLLCIVLHTTIHKSSSENT